MTQSLYQDHFGITENPFSIIPNPSYLYMSRRHQDALAHLLYGVGGNGGFVLLTGEVGTGKTTLCRALLEQLPENTDLALILNPKLTEAELMAAICDEMRIPYPPGTTSLKDFFDLMNHHLLQAHAKDRNPVLMIDEAQNLHPDVLELVRLLTNLETAHKKLLQIILVGQPELNSTLAQKHMRQVSQRITARFHLDPLNAQETRRYIDHRLNIAGLTPQVFSNGAVQSIHKSAQGIPRLINSICDRALLAAYVEGDKKVTRKRAQRASAEVLAPKAHKRAANVWRTLALAAILISALVIGALDPYGWGVRATVERLWDPFPLTKTPSSSAISPPPAISPAPNQVANDNTAPQVGDSVQLGTLDNAFVQLFDLWQQNYLTLEGQTPCEKAARANLGCWQGPLDMAGLKALNRPLVGSFLMPNQKQMYGVISTITDNNLDTNTGEKITVDFGGRTIAMPTPAFAARWLGDALVLWKPHDLIRPPLSFAQQGQQVVELRRLLAKAGYADATNDITGQGRVFFGASLREKVRQFQQAYGLNTTGTVDPQTLMRLTGVARETYIAPLVQASLAPAGK